MTDLADAEPIDTLIEKAKVYGVSLDELFANMRTLKIGLRQAIDIEHEKIFGGFPLGCRVHLAPRFDADPKYNLAPTSMPRVVVAHEMRTHDGGVIGYHKAKPMLHVTPGLFRGDVDKDGVHDVQTVVSLDFSDVTRWPGLTSMHRSAPSGVTACEHCWEQNRGKFMDTIKVLDAAGFHGMFVPIDGVPMKWNPEGQQYGRAPITSSGPWNTWSDLHQCPTCGGWSVAPQILKDGTVLR